MNKENYICSSCGWESLGWVGRCANCGKWGTLILEDTNPSVVDKGFSKGVNIDFREVNSKKVKDVDLSSDIRINSGFKELNLVLGGGYVRGSVILLSGAPGVGKSTIALHSLLKLLKLKNQFSLKENVYFISAEESITQIAKRVKRIEPQIGQDLNIIEGKNIDKILKNIKGASGGVLVWDSLQTFFTGETDGISGGISQTRSICSKIIEFSRVNNCVSIVIGQITKEGIIAGPKLVEHMVDVVLLVDILPDSNVRILRSSKNRFGSTLEVGILEMNESGFTDIDDSFNIFKAIGDEAPGSVMCPAMEGSRVILVEVQSLVTHSVYGIPQRLGRGIQKSKLDIIIAIITKILKLPLGKYDVFVNIAGGMQLNEPACDLAIANAIISSYKNIVIPRKFAFSGELSLNGVVRPSINLERRVNSAVKLGVEKVYCSFYESEVNSAHVKRIKSILDLKDLYNFKKR